jgi:hypothetical protein
MSSISRFRKSRDLICGGVSDRRAQLLVAAPLNSARCISSGSQQET